MDASQVGAPLRKWSFLAVSAIALGLTALAFVAFWRSDSKLLSHGRVPCAIASYSEAAPPARQQLREHRHAKRTSDQDFCVCVLVRTHAAQHRGLAGLITSLIAASEPFHGQVMLDIVPTDSRWLDAARTEAGICELAESPQFTSPQLDINVHTRASDEALSKYWHSKCGRKEPGNDYGYLQTDLVLRSVLSRAKGRVITS